MFPPYHIIHRSRKGGKKTAKRSSSPHKDDDENSHSETADDPHRTDETNTNRDENDRQGDDTGYSAPIPKKSVDELRSSKEKQENQSSYSRLAPKKIQNIRTEYQVGHVAVRQQKMSTQNLMLQLNSIDIHAVAKCRDESVSRQKTIQSENKDRETLIPRESNRKARKETHDETHHCEGSVYNDTMDEGLNRWNEKFQYLRAIEQKERSIEKDSPKKRKQQIYDWSDTDETNQWYEREKQLKTARPQEESSFEEVKDDSEPSFYNFETNKGKLTSRGDKRENRKDLNSETSETDEEQQSKSQNLRDKHFMKKATRRLEFLEEETEESMKEQDSTMTDAGEDSMREGDFMNPISRKEREIRYRQDNQDDFNLRYVDEEKNRRTIMSRETHRGDERRIIDFDKNEKDNRQKSIAKNLEKKEKQYFDLLDHLKIIQRKEEEEKRKMMDDKRRLEKHHRSEKNLNDKPKDCNKFCKSEKNPVHYESDTERKKNKYDNEGIRHRIVNKEQYDRNKKSSVYHNQGKKQSTHGKREKEKRTDKSTENSREKTGRKWRDDERKPEKKEHHFKKRKRNFSDTESSVEERKKDEVDKKKKKYDDDYY